MSGGTGSRDDDRTEAAQDRPAAPKLAPGDNIGRYQVRELLGAGGMGEVFAAYDPVLDRLVALKMIRAEVGGVSPDARARFKREAQAMARLNHPNVVSVFDVQTAGGRVVVAMELVEGPTLAAWLAARPRTWREVVAVMLQAGRGLAAAHAAGIVHRDFKPSNVIIGDRVRVADFGLARAPHDVDPPSVTSSPSLSLTVTQTGAALGTVAYMAPEQRDGRAVTAASDQYAFAVTLHEALHGARPGDPAPRPARVVPRWLRRVVDRGLRAPPAERYPSMDALLADLGHDRARLRRRLIFGAVLVAALGAIVAERLTPQGDRAAPCSGAGARLAGAWDASRHAGVEKAFAATGLPHAAAVWERVRLRLDEYAVRWTEMYGSTCRATRIDGSQSEALMDLRMACLDRRLGVLGALTAAWSRGMNAEDVRSAIDAAQRLDSLAECADARALTERHPPPADPARAEVVRIAQRHVDEARAIHLAHRWPEALAAADAAHIEAQATGWPQVEAEALRTRAKVAYSLDMPGVAPKLIEATRLAAAARDDSLFAATQVDLVSVLSDDPKNAAEVLRLGDLVDAAITRAGGDPRMHGRVMTHRGEVLLQADRFDEARRWFTEAHALTSATFGPTDGETLLALTNLARTERASGNYAEAIRRYAQALPWVIVVFGAQHPRVALQLNSMAIAMQDVGDYAGASLHYRWALAIQEQVVGPSVGATAITIVNLAGNESERGNLDDSEALFRRALAIEEKVYGPKSPQIAVAFNNFASVLRKRGRFDEARANLERALEANAAAYGPEHSNVAYPHDQLAMLCELQGDLHGALAHRDQAIALRVSLGADHPLLLISQTARVDVLAQLGRCTEVRRTVPALIAGLSKDGETADVADARMVRARCELAAGRARVALLDLERALAIRDRFPQGPSAHGRIRLLLARALWALGRRAEAVAAARRAATELVADADGAIDLAAARRFLAAHGR